MELTNAFFSCVNSFDCCFEMLINFMKPLAAEMAEESEKLKNRADKLLKDAVKALEMAQNDDVKCREQKEKIAKKLK